MDTKPMANEKFFEQWKEQMEVTFYNTTDVVKNYNNMTKVQASIIKCHIDMVEGNHKFGISKRFPKEVYLLLPNFECIRIKNKE